MDQNRYSAGHPTLAEYIRVGAQLRLLSIDEPSGEEGRSFVAQVDAILHQTPPVVVLVFESADEGDARRLSASLEACFDSEDCNLHVEMVTVEGPLFQSSTAPVVLKLLAPNGPIHDFRHITVGRVSEGGELIPERHLLRFGAELVV